jgi:pyrroline-5-carboxylate reductase
MIEKIGFIGAGNMATAIIKGLMTQNAFPPDTVLAFDTDAYKTAALLPLGIAAAQSIGSIAEACHYIVLAVKPQVYQTVLEELAPLLRRDTVLVSIAAGISTDSIRKAIGFDTKVVRAMPNTPLLLGKGATAISSTENVNLSERSFATKLFSASGITQELPEALMNAVIGVNGSTPALLYLLCKVVAEWAQSRGIPEKVATALFAQTLIGSGEMLAGTGKDAVELIKMVTSKGGTTEKMLESLESSGFEKVLAHALDRGEARANELGS